jgi:hypothetical protein
MSRVRISQFCSFPTDVQNYKPTIFDLTFTSSPNRGHTRSGRESTKNRHEKVKNRTIYEMSGLKGEGRNQSRGRLE